MNNSSPVLSTKLIILENHDVSVYTKEFFLKFRKEMKNAKLFFVVRLVSHDTLWSYTLSKFKHPKFKWEVQFWLNILTLKCLCMMFESIDIPCYHMIIVMKVKHLEEIPTSCILKRWTKLAKAHPRSPSMNGMENNIDQIVQYNSISFMCNKLPFYASHTSSSFLEANNEIESLIVKIEEPLIIL